jgi:hypothetical protein
MALRSGVASASKIDTLASTTDFPLLLFFLPRFHFFGSILVSDLAFIWPLTNF